MKAVHDFSLYLFDFDYTLVDSSAGIVECMNYALKKMNLPPKSDKVIKKTIGCSLENTFMTLTGNKSPEECQIFRSYFMEHSVQCMHDKVILFDDTIDTLFNLKTRNKQIGIVSAKDNFTIQKIAKKFQFYEYIDVIVGEDDAELQKPCPDQIFVALNRLGESSDRTVYIGDSFVDAQTAQNAKVAFLGVTSGTTTRKEFEVLPHLKIVDRLKEIL